MIAKLACELPPERVSGSGPGASTASSASRSSSPASGGAGSRSTTAAAARRPPRASCRACASPRKIFGGARERRRFELALRDEERRARLLLDNLPDWILRVGADGVYRDVGGSAPTSLGPVPIRAGDSIDEVWPPDEAAARHAWVREALATGETVEVEYAQEHDGATSHREVRVVPLGADEVLVTVRDVTARREAERAVMRRDAVLEALSVAAERLIGAPSLDEGVTELLALLGSAAEVARAEVFLLDDEGRSRRASIAFAWHAPGLSSALDVADLHGLDLEARGFGELASNLELGQPYRLVIPDTVPTAAAARLEERGIRSLLAVPIVVGETCRGWLSVSDCARERDWLPAEVEAFRAAAGIVSSALGRAEAEAASARRDALLRAVGAAAEHLMTGTLEASADHVLRLLGEASGVSRAYLFQIVPGSDPERWAQRFEWTAPGIEPTLGSSAWDAASIDELGFSRWTEAFRRGEVVHGPSESFPAAVRDRLLADGTLSVIDAPILVDGELWGDVGFDDCGAARTWAPAEVEALRTLGNLLAGSIARERAVDALRGSEAKSRLLLENLPDYVVTMDRAGRYREVRGLARTESFAPNEVSPGASIYDVMDRELADERVGWVREALDQGAAIERESHIVVEGEPRIRDVRLVPTGPDEALIVIRDVTERRAAEAALERRDAILQAVAAATARRLERPLEECGDEVVELLGRSAGVSRAYVFEYRTDPSGARLLHMRHEWTAEGVPATRDRPEYGGAEAGVLGFARWIEAYERGEYVQGLVRELPEEERRPLEEEGTRAVVGVPILVDGELWGDIGFDQCDRERVWSLAEIDALRTAASILASSIRRAGTEDALRRSEEQLRQSQKMDAIGRLAGGVAHDFNNLLTVITGYGELALSQRENPTVLAERLDEILKAAARAASLTNQLLVFGRQQVLQPKALDVNAIVGEAERMLRRVIGEDIEFSIDLEPDVPTIEADPGQLHQVLLNLVVNARDAMPRGGRLRISTATVDVGEEEGIVLPGAGLAAVRISVSDTGTGMDEEVRARVFEPFFTTKAAGKGTGLGLSTVHGIVTQSGGAIVVDSAPGAGSTFRVYLPVAVAPSRAGRPSGSGPSSPWAAARRSCSPRTRSRCACSCARCSSGAATACSPPRGPTEAIELARAQGPSIDLLITDVVMPRMSGRELAERLVTDRPELPVLFISGYTDDAVLRHGIRENEAELLQKPFTSAALTRRVRELLDRPR
ncbi:MAG: GAF domain-containing protein [Thermoleophilia bacterium]